mgnify:CR=1 FL=1
MAPSTNGGPMVEEGIKLDAMETGKRHAAGGSLRATSIEQHHGKNHMHVQYCGIGNGKTS